MSTTPKGTTLRLVAPKDSANKVLASLGRTTKTESSDIVLNAGRHTTEGILKNIRELTRLRDELLHTIRQLGLAREPRKSSLENLDYEAIVAQGRKQLEDERRRYQETQATIDSLERQIEETKNLVNRTAEVAEAGFASGELHSRQGEFTRILGRMPTRKLEAAQRAIEANLKGQVVFATGNRKKDWVYILLATPGEEMSQVLQTLILYDFVQTETPTSEQPDLKTALSSWEDKKENLSRELETSRESMKTIKSQAAETLNRLADMSQDALLQLRAVLRMGEGTSVALILAWFEKSPSAKLLASLPSQGALVEAD